MNVKSVVENKEKYEVELTVEVGQAEFEAGLDQAYRKSRGSISVPGFRKGKAPRKVIEGMYGASVFYEDAIEAIYPQACQDAIKENNLDSVAPPQVEILDLGKEGFSFKAIITVRPVITLKQYKGLEADKVLPTVTDEAVDAELQQYIDRATQLEAVERAAQMGDTAVIDYAGYKDGALFDGGSAQGYELLLGSHSFIPGFEEQVVGMSAGEEKDIDLTFPEEYHAEELAGKPVTFKVKCVEVKEKKLPEIDDEFAKDVSEFDTLDEFKKDLGEKLKIRRQEQADRDFEAAVIDALIEKLECDVPEAMVDYRAEKMLEDYANRIQSQGIGFEDYLRMMGMTIDDLRAQSKTTAERNVRSDLALEAVAAAEGIETADSEVDAEIAKLAEQYKMEEDKVRAIVNVEDIRSDLTMRKALDLVKGAVKKSAKRSAKKTDDADAGQDGAEEKPAKKKSASKAKAVEEEK